MGHPTYPWKKGKQPGYEMAVVEVEICLDDLKQVYSSHRPADYEDQEMLMSWPSGGQEHVAFALLSEATKREAIFSLLLNISNKPGFLEFLAGLSEEERDKAFEDISTVVMHTMGQHVQRLAKDAVIAAYEDVKGNLG